ncbi:hypothetical protein QBC35DRAFT_551759 [Podospora australis]|uniref:Uncharacterized protein n=1 Tax=Podospora australis TaxID=1536484 RepID=A0AAN6WU82_9PEZI|nr:hypothetical protein QBC35DRAFT_551759 [Podospora australis]
MRITRYSRTSSSASYWIRQVHLPFRHLVQLRMSYDTTSSSHCLQPSTAPQQQYGRAHATSHTRQTGAVYWTWLLARRKPEPIYPTLRSLEQSTDFLRVPDWSAAGRAAKSDSAPPRGAACGVCAAIASDALMNPFDVIKQRLQIQNSAKMYRSMLDCAKYVYRGSLAGLGSPSKGT